MKKFKKRSKLFVLLMAVVMMVSGFAAVSHGSSDIGKAKAKAIAVKNSGHKMSEVKMRACYVDYDDGVKVYEVRFDKAPKRYAYEIKASNGRILEKKIRSPYKKVSGPKIGHRKAKAIALKRAGLKAGQVFDLESEYEYEHGKSFYEVSFDNPVREYDVYVNAVSGKVFVYGWSRH